MQNEDTKEAMLGLEKGKVNFCNHDFLVENGVLVPRIETELLVKTVLNIFQNKRHDDLYFLDICSGVANIASSLALEMPKANLAVSDLNEVATKLSKKNVDNLGLTNRIEVFCGDLFQNIPSKFKNKCDFITCNPPYISTNKLETDKKHLLDLEPKDAFDGGPYGLSIHQKVVKEAKTWLKSGGYIFFEIGIGQEKQLKIIMERSKNWHNILFVYDKNNIPRVVYAEYYE